jgi:hypothetical protein
MLGMNVNMIRLHCHFSNPELYELADERGVLLWQDFLEAWYPHDRGFAQRAAALYDRHIRYVRNHPSVALWAASDEEDFENYRELTKHLAPRPSALDPQARPVVRSTGRFGDSHVYYGWYGGSIWQYAKMPQAFVPSWARPPCPTTRRSSASCRTGGRSRPPGGGTWRRLQIPEREGLGRSRRQALERYVPRTRAYVARLFQLASNVPRRRSNEGAGRCCTFRHRHRPSVTMAAIDIDRLPPGVRRGAAQLRAGRRQLQYDRDRQPGETFQCGLWAINDRWTAVERARVRWRIVDGAGKARASGE